MRGEILSTHVGLFPKAFFALTLRSNSCVWSRAHPSPCPLPLEGRGKRSAPVILLWGNNRRANGPHRRADLGRSRLELVVRACDPDLFRARLGLGLPVHRVRHGLAHLGEPPFSPRHAVLAPASEDAGLRSVESEFELFVGCHNFVLITTPLSQAG